jgi:threonine dehydrogenase-like Zn-dependent dehydrogenase
MKQTIPETQYAIQLVGPDELLCNEQKEVSKPGPYQILAKVEAVGLCFSDLKLLKQFDQHARKTDILSGIEKSILDEIPSYKPGTEPTVPGHETFATVVAVGDKVIHSHPGQRVLVQTDYRWLKTAGSNTAFGYGFEGGLQQYVLMDERVIVDPVSNESFLIPVEKEMSSSAIALVEPWACVESSFITEERNTIKSGGKLLVVVESDSPIEGVAESFAPAGAPASITVFSADSSLVQGLDDLGVQVANVDDLSSLADEQFDDIVYFGSQKTTIELLDRKLGTQGIINIVLGGKTIGQEVSVGVGRTHYGMTRWIGTTGTNAADSYKNVPDMGEIRKGDKVLIIGAAGPMGQMHTIRLVCSGIEDIAIVGTDFDDERLKSLAEKANPMAKERKVELSLVNSQKNPINEKFSYFAIMAPVAPLVAQSIKDSLEGALINVFAGIPASVYQEIDLDTYITNKCFMFGTSGSRLSDMKIVLEKVLSEQLNTDCSVDAVCGMAGAIDGIRAVEARAMPGKIIVYPQLEKLALTPISKLGDKYPSVAEKLCEGIWTKQAEDELLKVAGS